MQILITDPVLQTIIFGIIFCGALIFSIRKPKSAAFFPNSVTNELKGFAILGIIFSHIGYFLSVDNRFLYPFSIFAGVGVNLFLFLSGFGLTLSSLRKPLSITGFYVKRLQRLFIPMWIVIFILFVSDYFFLQKNYAFQTIWQSALGFFPVADLFKNLNSPLWYFTLILFYYILFPLTFWKKFPYLSPVLILIISYFLLETTLPVDIDLGVLSLYRLHFVSFPLGVLFAIMTHDQKLTSLKIGFKKAFLENDLKYIFIFLFTILFAYLSIHSGVGLSKNIEQTISLITMFLIIFIFVAKRFQFTLLSLFGVYSYEIYLIHWPLLSRYDILYLYLPASIATIAYLGLFLGLGYLFKRFVERLFIKS